MTRGHDPWGEDLLHMLKELWASQLYTMQEIAQLLSTPRRLLSRGAIAGKISRHGLVREQQKPRKKKLKPVKAEARAPKRIQPDQWMPTPAPEPPRLYIPPGASMVNGWVIRNRVPEVKARPANGVPVPLLELGHGCKWPVDYRGGVHWFCNRKRRGLQYCVDHEEQAWS